MKRTLLLHGQFHNFSSFAIVNRQLAKGFTALGYQVTVMPSDGTHALGPSVRELDIYFAHDHPYDVLNAPGRLNVFLLAYEYARILKKDELLVERLNHFFDLLFVPSEFTREVCAASGIQIPIIVCPHGADHAEFHPSAQPVELPTRKRFKFLYLGGATERKGTDVLIRAFTEEFSAQDDAALVLKTFGYEHLLAPFERALGKLRRKRNAPEIVHLHGKADSVAGYYTAADCGVFPFRGEGFGLPILDCLACGRAVIVTQGTAPVEFCNESNALFIPAKRVTWQGKQQLEPNRAALRKLMRGAYKGNLPSNPQEISASVAAWTWERTVAQMDKAIQRNFPSAPIAHTDSIARVGYAFYQKGATSWKKVARKVDHALAHQFDYVPLSFHAAPPRESLQVLLGDSGFALEHLARAARVNPKVKRILVRGNGPFESAVAVENRERLLCGVPSRYFEPMEFWRHRREYELSDQIIVFGRAAKELFIAANYPANKLHYLPLGIDVQPKPLLRRARTLRFLFLATNPFRKGVRILFQAWDALRPQDAELMCIASNEILQSQLLLRYLVRNPNIHFKPLVSRRQVDQEYMNCDIQVLPSFEEGFSVAISEGMGYGKPAIFSKDIGTSELITHLENGYLVRTGDAKQLKRALEYFCENQRAIPRMGQAAFETAREYTWEKFERGIAELVESQLENG